MNTMNATNLLEALPLLSPEDLKQLRDRASALLTVGPRAQLVPRTGSSDGFTRDMYTSLNDALFRRTQVRGMPFEMFRRTPTFKNHFAPAALSAGQANDQWFPKQTQPERLSMTQLYAKLILEHLDVCGSPVVWPLISFKLGELPAVVDQAFPGYAASGLLGKVQHLRCRPRQ